jgi:hypothetical protein
MSLDGSELGGDTSVEMAPIMADSNAVDSLSLNSTRLMHQTGTQSSCAARFRAWSFRLTIKADFAGAVDKEKRVKEHISERTTIERPFCVTSQIAFYDSDSSLLSAVPDSDGLVSIALHAFVQTRNGTWVRTMNEWIGNAVWTPVPWRATLNAEVLRCKRCLEVLRCKRCLECREHQPAAAAAGMGLARPMPGPPRD